MKIQRLMLMPVMLVAGLVGVAVYRCRRTCRSDEDSAVDVDAGDAGGRQAAHAAVAVRLLKSPPPVDAV